MPRACPVCARPDRDDVDAALRRGGIGLRGLAQQTGISKSVLGRHKTGCLGLSGVVEATEPPAESAGTGTGTPVPARVPVPVPAVPGPSPGEARARPLPTPPSEAKGPISFEDRVLYIADMMSRGRYLGRPTAKRLAAEWGVERGTVNDYARAAAVVCRADRGDLEQQREVSIGAWARIRDKAAANKNWKAAAAAQAGMDRAAGVVQATGPTVAISIVNNPVFLEVTQVILGALEPFPEARAAAVAAVRAALEARRAGRLPVGRADAPGLPGA